MDYGKYKYEAQKKKSEARKKQSVITVKEIKIRPGIEEHDYQVKMRAINKFIGEGDKVKVTLRFRGREMAHQELGAKILDTIAKVEQFPKMEGRQVTMVFAPRWASVAGLYLDDEMTVKTSSDALEYREKWQKYWEATATSLQIRNSLRRFAWHPIFAPNMSLCAGWSTPCYPLPKPLYTSGYQERIGRVKPV